MIAKLFRLYWRVSPTAHCRMWCRGNLRHIGGYRNRSLCGIWKQKQRCQEKKYHAAREQEISRQVGSCFWCGDLFGGRRIKEAGWLFTMTASSWIFSYISWQYFPHMSIFSSGSKQADEGRSVTVPLCWKLTRKRNRCKRKNLLDPVFWTLPESFSCYNSDKGNWIWGIKQLLSGLI